MFTLGGMYILRMPRKINSRVVLFCLVLFILTYVAIYITPSYPSPLEAGKRRKRRSRKKELSSFPPIHIAQIYIRVRVIGQDGRQSKSVRSPPPPEQGNKIRIKNELNETKQSTFSTSRYYYFTIVAPIKTTEYKSKQ